MKDTELIAPIGASPVCPICGRESCLRNAGFLSASDDCYRLGYERLRAALAMAEEEAAPLRFLCHEIEEITGYAGQGGLHEHVREIVKARATTDKALALEYVGMALTGGPTDISAVEQLLQHAHSPVVSAALAQRQSCDALADALTRLMAVTESAVDLLRDDADQDDIEAAEEDMIMARAALRAAGRLP